MADMQDRRPELSKLQSVIKEHERSSKEAERSERRERNKLKKAHQQGKKEEVKIYAANSRLMKKKKLFHLRMVCRMNATACIIEGAITEIKAYNALASLKEKMMKDAEQSKTKEYDTDHLQELESILDGSMWKSKEFLRYRKKLLEDVTTSESEGKEKN